MLPFYVPEIIDLNGKTIKQIDDAISIQAARAFNVAGSATIVLPDYYDRSLFRLHTRMKLWRYDYSGIPSLFGDTIWFLKKTDHAISEETYTLTMVDSFAMLATRIVAYTSLTPYADKTLEEFALVNYNDSLRIDTMMLAYMRENFGSLALDADRLNSYIEIERDKNQGPYGEKQSSWQEIDATLSDLARQASANGLNLFYDLIPIEDGHFLFRIWNKVRGIDRGSTAAVNLVLSDTDGMITDIHDIEDYTDVATVCYALGYDSGPSQMIEVVESPLLVRNDPFGRIEMTTNASDSDIPSVLIATAQQALNGRRPKRLVTAKVVENSSLRYARDISYGDLLSIEVAGRKYDVAVNAVSVTWDESGEQLDIHLSGEEAIGAIITPGTTTPGINEPTNTRPVANAGEDQSVAIDDGAVLVGSAVDDGLPDPPATLTYQWSKVSGPGIVTFLDDTDPTTTATFDTTGVYVLRLTVSDSALFDEDEVTITVADVVTTPPNFGLITGQQLVAGIGSDGYVYVTTDFQTPSGSGGPTWTRTNLTIAATIYTFVVDPFSPGYIEGVGTINGWIVNDTDIYRVTDLFGTPAKASVYTFATATVGASFHWRTIQASFGAFFAEGDNPWLMCVSYYGSTGGHTGTWATYSIDGGVTWSAEVQISAHYNTTAAVRFNPIGVYLSPKTPGLALIAAYSETAADAQAVGYVSTNWGATWAAYTDIDTGQGHAGAIHLPWPDNELEDIIYHGNLVTEVTPGTDEALMPHWGRVIDSTLSDILAEPTYILNLEANAEDSSESSGTHRLLMAPPADARRAIIEVVWDALRSRSPVGTSFAGGNINFSVNEGSTNQTRVSDTFDYALPAYEVNASGSFMVEWTSPQGAGGPDWELNRDNLDVYPTGGTYANYARLHCLVSANSILAGRTAHTELNVQATITEIELEGGTIYTPTLPITGHNFRLKRIIAGVVQDISPSDTGVFYGVNGYGFTIRSFDNDRQFMALAGIGNEISDDPADDKVGLWVSTNAGTAWSNILAPVAASNVRNSLQIAFSGDSSDVLFAWGGWSNGSLPAIWYSDDFGATLDSREGNINSLGTVALIGIAGGPTP